MSADFGSRLRDLRKTRTISQLDLAMDAEISIRHISFLENGRSKPSVDMIHRLSDCLQLPKAMRGMLLGAAGYSSHLDTTPLDEESLAPFHTAAERMLERHMPYPGLAIDEDGAITLMNRASCELYSFRGLVRGIIF